MELLDDLTKTEYLRLKKNSAALVTTLFTLFCIKYIDKEKRKLVLRRIFGGGALIAQKHCYNKRVNWFFLFLIKCNKKLKILQLVCELSSR